MRRFVLIFMVAILLCSVCIAEDDPIKMLGEFNTLWDIPFGLSKEEVVQRFADEKGITLVESYAKDDYTGYKLDENQSFSLLGYPITLSIACNSSFSVNGEKYEVPSQVYDYMSIEVEDAYNRDKNTQYFKDGFDQLSTFMKAFSKKYGEPTLVYYNTSKEMTSDSEYHKANAEFITLGNIVSLMKTNYSLTICLYYDNIFVMDYICDRFCSISIFCLTSNSDYTWEGIKEKFPEKDQKPDPVELGV